MSQRASFLIASEDLQAAEALGAVLFEAGFGGKRVASMAEALLELERGAYDVVIADHVLKDGSGGALPQAKGGTAFGGVSPPYTFAAAPSTVPVVRQVPIPVFA